VIVAGLVQLLVSTLSGDYYPTVGASGGMLFGYFLIRYWRMRPPGAR